LLSWSYILLAFNSCGIGKNLSLKESTSEIPPVSSWCSALGELRCSHGRGSTGPDGDSQPLKVNKSLKT